MGNQNRVRPAWGIQAIGLTELVGINEQVDQNDFSASVEVKLGGSGVIRRWMFYQTEDQSGSLLSVEGTLLIFDADPEVDNGDTVIDAAAWVHCIGKVDVTSGDWVGDGMNGQVAEVVKDVEFHDCPSIWLVFKLTSATAINSGANDDEQLEVNAWYERWS